MARSLRPPTRARDRATPVSKMLTSSPHACARVGSVLDGRLPVRSGWNVVCPRARARVDTVSGCRRLLVSGCVLVRPRGRDGVEPTVVLLPITPLLGTHSREILGAV